MRLITKLGLGAVAAMTVAAPAVAGEVTGSGKDITLHGQSWCRYSGLNDTPYEDGMGQTQSYGQLVRLYPEFVNPQDFNPATSYPESCNPTREGAPPPGAEFPPNG